MILSLGQGEPSYVPDGLLGPARDHADVSYLAFLQCYARNMVNWEIICFFSGHLEEWCSLAEIIKCVDEQPETVVARLDELVASHLLVERVVAIGLEYAVSPCHEMRYQVARVGSEWRCLAQQER